MGAEWQGGDEWLSDVVAGVAPEVVYDVPPQCENRIDFVRTVQEPLGYKDVSTPMVYTHVLRRCGLGARSPAEALELGGLCLPGGAVAFLGFFAYLAARFNYPDVLDSPAATVFPSLLATGQQGRLVWAIYALLPLICLPAGLAAYEALAPVQRGAMRLALLCAVVATIGLRLRAALCSSWRGRSLTISA